MRARGTRVVLALMVIASMSMTLGAGIRWGALRNVATVPVVDVIPSLPSETSSVDQTVSVDVAPADDSTPQ